MNSVIKIPSNQGVLSASQNLLDFEFGDGSNYDLSKSYVSLDVSLKNAPAQSVKATAQDSSNTAYQYQFKVSDKAKDGASNPNNIHENIVLVKNAHFRNQNKGMVEDIRRVDILRTNLRNYSKNLINRDSLVSVKGLSSGEDVQGNSQSVFLEQNSVGDVLSKSREHEELQLPLSHIFNTGVMPSYSSSNYGRSKIHLELNLDSIKAQQVPIKDKAGKKTLSDSATGNGGTISTYGGSDNPLIWANTESQDHTCPFYVGAMINFLTATPTGAGAITTEVRQITKITENADGTVSMEIKDPFPLANTQKYASITIALERLATHDDLDLVFSNPQLVLQITNQPAPAVGSVDYTTFTTEEDNGNSRASFTKNYTIEAEAFNLYVSFAQKFMSADNGLSSYRIRVNGEDSMNRDISTSSGLHYDRIQMGLRNGDRMVGNLQEGIDKINETNSTKYDAGNISESKMILQPLPQTQNPKMVQLSCNQTGLLDFQLFKEVMRVM